MYPLPVDKAAAIFESIVSNYPFIDGNKRTAYVLMRLVLLENNLDIYTDQNEKYKFVISAAKGEIKFDEIREWLIKKYAVTNKPDATSRLKKIWLHLKNKPVRILQ